MAIPPGLDFGKRLVRQILDDEVLDLSAGLAYRFLFALFPFGIFLAALAAFVATWLGVGDPTNEILGAIGDNLPPDVAAQIAPQLETVLGEARPGLLSIGALGALWAATGGVGAVQKAMNKAYDVPETRNIVVKTGGAITLTLLGSAGIIVAFVTIVGGSVLTQEAVRTLGVPASAWDTVSLLRWPLVLALVALAVAVLLRYAPNVAISFRWALVGGAVFAIGWLVATGLFGLYVANFGHYSNTYGALGGIVVLMLWFYLTAVLLLVAAEVTSLLVKDHEPHRVATRQREIAADDRDGADTQTGDEPAPGAIPLPAWRPTTMASSTTAMTTTGPTTRLRPRPVPEPPGSGVFAALLVASGAITGAAVGLLARDDRG